MSYLTPSGARPREPRRLGKVFGWILFVGLAMLLFILLQKGDDAHPSIPLSDFETRLKADKVRTLSVEADTLVGEFTGVETIGKDQVLKFRTHIPKEAVSWAYVQWLLDNKHNAQINVTNEQNLLLDILVPLIPWLMIFGYIHFFIMRPLRRFQRPVSGAAALLLLVCVVNGCGYHNGAATNPSAGASDRGGYHWGSLYRSDIRTVAVPIFVSKDFNRGVEFELSKALINQLEARSPYKVVPRERADTILEGEIVSVRANTLSNDFRSSIPQEQLLTVTVNFTWKDLRSGRILVQRRGFEQAATYYATLGEARFYGREQAAERLATAIVQELQTDW